MYKVTFTNGSTKEFPNASRVIFPGEWVVLQRDRSRFFSLYVDYQDIAVFKAHDVMSVEKLPVYGVRYDGTFITDPKDLPA